MVITPTTVILRKQQPVWVGSPPRILAAELLNFLCKLHIQSEADLHHTVEYWQNYSVHEEEKYLQAINDSERSLFLGAKLLLENEVTTSFIGTLSLIAGTSEKTRHVAELGMGVLADWQNHGLGREMLSIAEHHAAQSGIKTIILHVREFNKKAIALYQHFGYVQTGILKMACLFRENYYDDYIFQKIL